MMAQKPLMLKEYLELDSGSESSSSSGFRCAPRRANTVRCLLEAELSRGREKGSRRRHNARGARSKNNALTKLSAVINAVRLLPFSSSSPNGGGDGHSGGFSRRLIRGGFWKPKKARRREGPEKVRVLDIVRLPSCQEDADELRSFDFPSPLVSSCSSCSESTVSSDFVPSSLSSSENLDDIAAAAAADSKKESSPPTTPKPAAGSRHRPPPKGIEERGMASPDECHLEEEKEQLSPVSVMDFPYEPEDDDEDVDVEEDDDSEDDESSISSPSFNQSLANLERTKLQLLQKIRLFESLAELDVVDLEKRFEDDSTSGDERETASDCQSDGLHVETRTPETRAWALLEELRRGAPPGPLLGSFEKLLLDFFLHGLRGVEQEDADANPGRPSRSKGSDASRREESMLRAARDWVRGHVGEIRGDATITEMEGNGRWGCRAAAEEEELGAGLEGYVFGLLLDELVVDLGSP